MRAARAMAEMRTRVWGRNKGKAEARIVGRRKSGLGSRCGRESKGERDV